MIVSLQEIAFRLVFLLVFLRYACRLKIVYQAQEIMYIADVVVTGDPDVVVIATPYGRIGRRKSSPSHLLGIGRKQRRLGCFISRDLKRIIRNRIGICNPIIATIQEAQGGILIFHGVLKVRLCRRNDIQIITGRQTASC